VGVWMSRMIHGMGGPALGGFQQVGDGCFIGVSSMVVALLALIGWGIMPCYH